MNRRHFLSFLGLAPVVAAVPVMALPRPDKPQAKDVEQITVKVTADMLDFERLNRDISDQIEWCKSAHFDTLKSASENVVIEDGAIKFIV